MGGDKDSGSAKTYDYFGTIAGLVAWGPVDGIHAILVDGKEIFAAPPGGLAASGDSTDLQPVDSKWLQKNGYIRIYWGTQTQAANVQLGANHPPYRGFCYVVLHRFLFGRERSTSPNVEVVVWRKPRPPSFLEPVAMEDGQVNPVPVMAEWIAGLVGLEQPDTLFDTASWTDAAAWVWADPDRRARMAVSCLLVDTGDVRGRLAAMLELTELALCWNEAGRLALRRLNLGETPPGLSTIDARYATTRTVLRAGGWRDVPTGVFVRFVDRDRRWKESGQKIDNILARQLRGEPNRQELDLPWVTRQTQAAAVATRYLVRAARPACTLSVQVRSAAADTLQVGSKVLVDVDPEPGGQGLAQPAIVTERREPREGPVSLTLVADTLAEALPYFPVWVPAAESGLVVRPVVHAGVFPLHPDAWGLTAAIAILAARPQADAVGMTVYFAPLSDPDGFTRLGQQSGFGVRTSLAADVAEDDQAWTLTLSEGEDGPDAYLASRTPDSPGAAAQDELLAILAQIGTGGVVVLDADGRPVMEFASIVSRTAIAPDQHTYTVLRGRRGSFPRPWTAGTVGWIVPLINLIPWTHPGISNLVRGIDEGRIRMVTFTRYGEDSTTPIPERGFFLPPAFDVVPKIAWTLPATNPATTDLAGQIPIDLTATDAGGDLVRLSITSRRGSDPVVPRFAEEFPQTESRRYQATLTFTGEGVHSLQVSARDSAGHETVNLWQIVVPPSGGGGAGDGPTFSPPSGEFSGDLLVTITAAPGHNFIAWAISPPQDSPPGGVWKSATGSSVQVWITGTQYLWAASGSGSPVTSPVVFASYVKRSPVS